MQKKLIKVNPSDNVAVALVNLAAGEVINFEGEEITIESDVKMKHKIAMYPFELGERIIMYGVLVGKASAPIAKGGLLSTENVKHADIVLLLCLELLRQKNCCLYVVQ